MVRGSGAGPRSAHRSLHDAVQSPAFTGRESPQAILLKTVAAEGSAALDPPEAREGL